MDSRILLGKILQRFHDKKISQVDGYNAFGYIRETDNSVYVTREKGKDTLIPFKKILTGIEMYQENPSLYECSAADLREAGITHINAVVWSLLHLLQQKDYK